MAKGDGDLLDIPATLANIGLQRKVWWGTEGQ